MTNQGLEVTEEDKLLYGGDVFHLSEYVAICRKHMWLIGCLVLTMSVGTALWSVRQPPIYESSAGLVFDPPAPRLMVEVDMRIVADNRDILTQVALLKTYPVLAETVRRLDLGKYPEYQYKEPSFFQQMLKKIQPDWFKDLSLRIQKLLLGPPKDTSAYTENLEDDEFPDSSEQSLVARLSRRIETNSMLDSKLVMVTVQSEDPKLAARTANTISTVYIDHMQEVREQAIESSSRWFNKHLIQLRERVEDSERVLHDYEAKHGLMGMGKRQKVTGQTLALVNSELRAAEKQISVIESKIQVIEKIRAKLKAQENATAIDPFQVNDLKGVLDSPEIQQISRKEVELSITMAELSERFGGLHPEITRLQIQRRALQSRLEAELERAHKQLKTDYELALRGKKAVKARLANEKAQQLTDDRLSVKLSILEREAASNKLLYDAFFKRMQETDLSKEIKSNKVYLAEPAIPNRTPIKPKPWRNTLLGLLLGLGMGIGLSFFLEYWDRSLKGLQDLDIYLRGLPILGWIPLVPKPTHKDLSRIIESDPGSASADSYRHIRTSIRLISRSKSKAEVFITSPGEHEGKTTLAVNLALALAQLEGYKVMLIDGDLRRPRLNKIFGIQQQTQNGGSGGLTEYLSKRKEITEILYQTDIPNLTLIPTGKWSGSHTELLATTQLAKLLAWCRENDFHVIMDGPPVLTIADSRIIASQIAETILVVSAGETSREGAKIALQQLRDDGARVLGVVMQKATLDISQYYCRTYEPSSPAPNNGILQSLFNKTLSRLR